MVEAAAGGALLGVGLAVLALGGGAGALGGTTRVLSTAATTLAAGDEGTGTSTGLDPTGRIALHDERGKS